MNSTRQRLFVLFSLLISGLFLWLAFSSLNPAQFWQSIQRAYWPLLLVGMGIYGLAVTVITLRWQFLLRAMAPVRLLPLIPLVAIGYMGNNIYPFRSGEILRIVLLRRDWDIPYARGATTVAVERVFDGLVMLTFVIVPLALMPIGSETVQRVAVGTAPIFGVALLTFFALAARPDLLRGLANWGAGLLPDALGGRVRGLADDIIDGLEGLRSARDLFGAVVSSYATWMIEASVYWIVALAFGLETGYAVALLTVGVVNLAGLLPASPGMLGVFEFFASEVMMAAGVASDVALAYAVTVHVVIWLPPTLAGFVFLVRRGMGLRAVTQAQTLQPD